MRTVAVLFLGVALWATGMGAQTAQELTEQANALFFEELWLTPYTVSAAPALRAQLEAIIQLYEQALALDPNYVPALNMLARCYYTLADLFLPEKEKGDAHAKGQEYAERSLRTQEEFLRVEKEKGFVEAVKTSTDIAALFYTYANWARKVELGGAVGILAAALRGDDRKLLALLERCLEVDRTYISGAPLRAAAGYWAKHPFARDLEKARAYLEEALASWPDYLENRLFLVQYYLIPREEWDQARAELQKIFDAPLGNDPLYNGHIKVLALDVYDSIRGK